MATRRTKGDGGLIQRHDHATCPPLDETGGRPRHKCQGRWVGTVDVWIDGEKRRKYVYARTKNAARQKLAKAIHEREQGTLVMQNQTVAAWMNHWLENVAGTELRPQTLAGYRSKIDTLIIPHLGRHRLTSLRPEHIRQWHALLRDRGSKNGKPLAEASVRQAHAIVKRALRDAVNDGRLAVSPADRVRSPKTTKSQRSALTLEQAQAALRSAKHDLRWWLAIFYGMRQGECLGLRWGDIDLEAGVLTIAQTLQMQETPTGRQIMFGPPKTKRSARTIPLLPPVLLAARLHRPAGVSSDTLVFTHDGGPVPPWRDNRAWHDFLESAGLPSVSLHSARHTASSVLAAADVPLWLVGRILGQTQVQTTAGYTHEEMAQVTRALTSGLDLLELD